MPTHPPPAHQSFRLKSYFLLEAFSDLQQEVLPPSGGTWARPGLQRLGGAWGLGPDACFGGSLLFWQEAWEIKLL